MVFVWHIGRRVSEQQIECVVCVCGWMDQLQKISAINFFLRNQIWKIKKNMK